MLFVSLPIIEMIRQLLFIFTFCFLLLAPSSVKSQFYQGSYQEFGKSRVQFNGFTWKYHNYKRFKNLL